MLQKSVNATFAPGIEGMPAVVEENHYTAVTKIAACVVTVGRFVFADDTKPNTHVNAKTTSGMVSGIVAYSRNYTGNFLPSMEIYAGQSLEIITTGKVWVKANNPSAAPKVGDFVYAKKADGTIVTSATNVADGIATNFVVTYVEKSDKNSMIIISNETAVGASAPTA